MNVKIQFKTLGSLKEFIFDASNIEVKRNTILIKKANLNSFTKNDINYLANSHEISFKLFSDNSEDMLEIESNKAFCEVEFMPSEEDRVRYLTNEIDKLSTELNKIINK